jgi:protein TonB
MSNESGNRGAAGDPLRSLKLTLIWSVLAVAIGGTAAYFLWPMLSGGAASPPSQTATSSAEPAPVAAVAAEPPPEGTVEELLEKAKVALRENRVVSPPGVNAVEIYLSVLDKEPNNPLAKSGLVEILQLALQATEQSIGRKEYDEAERQLDLIEQFQPDSYTLSKLRDRLSNEREAEVTQRLAAERAEAEAARRAELAAAEAAEAERRAAELAASEPVADPEPDQPEPEPVSSEPDEPVAATTEPAESATESRKTPTSTPRNLSLGPHDR